MTARISVIIPTCDRPLEFLLEALESVRAQTLSPVEVIVVDNGAVPLQVETLPDDVLYYRTKVRIGASRARNYGAEHASGSYLAFLDDDDWWDPDFLEKTYRRIVTSSADLVYSRKDIFNRNGRHVHKSPTEDKLNVETLLRQNPGTGGINLLINRNIFFKVGGFNSKFFGSEDRALALESLLHKASLVFEPETAAIERTHNGERLRDNPLRRIPFVWKYRSQLPPQEWIWRITRLFLMWVKQSANRICGACSRRLTSWPKKARG